MKILQPETTRTELKITAENSEKQNGSQRPEVSLSGWACTYLPCSSPGFGCTERGGEKQKRRQPLITSK